MQRARRASSNFRFKLASPKFIVYCMRNSPITNFSSTLQFPVTVLSHYISRKSKFFENCFFLFFNNNFSNWVLLSKKKIHQKWSPINDFLYSIRVKYIVYWSLYFSYWIKKSLFHNTCVWIFGIKFYFESIYIWCTDIVY